MKEERYTNIHHLGDGPKGYARICKNMKDMLDMNLSTSRTYHKRYLLYIFFTYPYIMISVFIHYIRYLCHSSYACNYTIKVSFQMSIIYAVTTRFYSYISSYIPIYPYLSIYIYIYRITVVYASMSIDHILMYPVISKFILKNCSISMFIHIYIYIYPFISLYIHEYPWISIAS